jgi:hypothetical protein
MGVFLQRAERPAVGAVDDILRPLAMPKSSENTGVRGIMGDAARAKVEAGYDIPNVKERPRDLSDHYNGRIPSEMGRLTVDPEGRALTAPYIAGYRTVGGNRGLDQVEAADIARRLGITDSGVSGLTSEGREVAGTYVPTRRTGERRISVNSDMSPADQSRAFYHELGHGLDDIAGLEFGKGGSVRIPGGRLRDDVDEIYHQMATGAESEMGRRAGPLSFGYPQSKVDSELVAEGFRAYMQNPVALKSLSPEFAKAMRDAVNSHPVISKYLQFNEVKGGGGSG